MMMSIWNKTALAISIHAATTTNTTIATEIMTATMTEIKIMTTIMTKITVRTEITTAITEERIPKKNPAVATKGEIVGFYYGPGDFVRPLPTGNNAT